MNIIIAGSARSGKTTLSLMLKDKGFVHYKMDSIKRGICDAYNLKYDNWEELSPIMVKIINRIILDNKSDVIYEKEDFLFDIPFLYPKDVSMLQDNPLIIFLGTAHTTVNERFNEIRKCDTKNLWTSSLSDEKLKSFCEENIAFSKYLEKECPKHHLIYFDTSKEREKVLNNILDYIDKKMIKDSNNV